MVAEDPEESAVVEVVHRMHSMFHWFAVGKPAQQELVERILAQGSQAKGFRAHRAQHRLYKSKVLDLDSYSRTVTIRAAVVSNSTSEVPLTVLDQQRRAVRDVCVKALANKYSYQGSAWILPHLHHYYSYSARVLSSQRATKPDFRLRLLMAEVCAVHGDLVHAAEHLESLVREHESAPKNWEVLFSSQESFVVGFIAAREGRWNEAKAALVRSFDLWLETCPELADSGDAAAYRSEVIDGNSEDVLKDFQRPWPSSFDSLKQAQSRRIRRESRVRLLAGRMPLSELERMYPEASSVLSLPHGMELDDVITFVFQRLRHTPPIGVFGYVSHEAIWGRLPR